VAPESAHPSPGARLARLARASLLPLLLATWPGVAPGQVLDVTAEVEPHRMARLSITWPEGQGMPPEGVAWLVFPPARVDAEARGDRLVFTAPPGDYSVAAMFVFEGRMTALQSGVRMLGPAEPGDNGNDPGPLDPVDPPPPDDDEEEDPGPPPDELTILARGYARVLPPTFLETLPGMYRDLADRVVARDLIDVAAVGAAIVTHRDREEAAAAADRALAVRALGTWLNAESASMLVDAPGGGPKRVADPEAYGAMLRRLAETLEDAHAPR
jgi:hypothetical protein